MTQLNDLVYNSQPWQNISLFPPFTLCIRVTSSLWHAMLFFTCCASASSSRRPSRFFFFELTSRGSSMHEENRAGGIDPTLSNRKSSWAERRFSGANRWRTRERQAWSPRAWYTWAGTAIVRREATCWNVPLPWKKRHPHVFCGLNGKWKSHAVLHDHPRRKTTVLKQILAKFGTGGSQQNHISDTDIKTHT